MVKMKNIGFMEEEVQSLRFKVKANAKVEAKVEGKLFILNSVFCLLNSFSKPILPNYSADNLFRSYALLLLKIRNTKPLFLLNACRIWHYPHNPEK